jgi:hypothetical protein
MFLGVEDYRPVRGADVTAVCGPIVRENVESLKTSQPFVSPRPVVGGTSLDNSGVNDSNLISPRIYVAPHEFGGGGRGAYRNGTPWSVLFAACLYDVGMKR